MKATRVGRGSIELPAPAKGGAVNEEASPAAPSTQNISERVIDSCFHYLCRLTRALGRSTKRIRHPGNPLPVYSRDDWTGCYAGCWMGKLSSKPSDALCCMCRVCTVALAI